jgi:hypothetical protein
MLTRPARLRFEVVLSSGTSQGMQATDEELVSGRHGRPAGVLIGFETDDDWFEYWLEHHPQFLRHPRGEPRRGSPADPGVGELQELCGSASCDSTSGRSVIHLA